MRRTWTSLHIHYNSDNFWLLTEAVAPMIKKLFAEGLLSNYFFIRYWEQGPHIRLRLLPSSQDCRDTLLQAAISDVEQFLAKRPSIFRFPSLYMSQPFTDLFVAEYSEETLRKKYGDKGLIPFERNNAICSVAYEPEFERYGGVDGAVIAEKYFEASSDVTLQLLSGENGHDFRIILGQAFRFFIYVCLIFFEAGDRREFVQAYERRWAQFAGAKHSLSSIDFSSRYERQREFLARATQSCADVMEGREQASDIEQAWIDTLRTLKADLSRAHAEQRLVIPENRGGPAAYTRYLLPSYIHMHNNRLGLGIPDEVYVAYLADKAFANHV